MSYTYIEPHHRFVTNCSLVDGGGEVRGADGQTAEIVPQRGVRDGSGCWDRRGAMAGDDAVDPMVVVVAWAAVGIPLAWGVYRTLQSVAQFFA